MEDERGSKQITLSVPYKMWKFLNDNPQINKSNVFQQAIYRIMYPKPKRMTPMMLLTSVMGICIGISLMLVSIGAMFFVGVLMSTILFILGVSLVLITILMFFMERRRLNANTI